MAFAELYREGDQRELTFAATVCSRRRESAQIFFPGRRLAAFALHSRAEEITAGIGSGLPHSQHGFLRLLPIRVDPAPSVVKFFFFPDPFLREISLYEMKQQIQAKL